MKPTPDESLAAFRPTSDYLVCIDSDGCVFDTMGIKQRECFCPWMISSFELQPVAEAARACKEFADLYSKTRGANRHVTIARILSDLLPSHPQVKARRFRVPGYPHYVTWARDPASRLSNDGIREAMAAADQDAKTEFARALEWSERVNWAIEEIVRGVPPFPPVRDTLDALRGRTDLVVVSATPLEALLREWREHEIDDHVGLICGQEMGTKTEHIASLRVGYAEERVLMVGDAPGDLRAAAANGVLFYPIIPGREEDSWRELRDKAIGRFLAGTYRGEYEHSLIARFDRALPENPPWEASS